MQDIPDKVAWRKKFFETMEILETMKLKELAAMTEEEGIRQLKLLGDVKNPWRERPDWSGLVEQQAAFRRRKVPTPPPTAE